MTSRTKTACIYLALLFYTLAPLLSVAIAAGVASATGNVLNEADAHPSMLFGHDVGGLLNSMLVFGWCAVLTIPTGGIAMIVFTLIRKPNAKPGAPN